MAASNRSDPRCARVIPTLVLVCVGCLFGAAHAFSQAAPLAAPEQFGVYASAGAQAWSEGLPVLDFDGTWSKGYTRDLARKHRAYESAAVEGGIAITSTRWGSPRVFNLGWIYRAEAFAQMSGEAAELAYRYQSQTDPQQASSFDAGSQSTGWRGKGVVVRLPVLATPSTNLQWSVQWLSLQRLRRTGTQGVVNFDESQAYHYSLRLSDDNSQATSPFLQPPPKQGEAMSMSLRWQGKAPDSPWAWHLRMDDVWSRLSWQGIHQESASLTSSVSTRDEQGYLNIRPALTGQYVRRQMIDRIPMTVEAQTSYQVGDDAWSLRLHRRWGIQQAWLGWQRTGANTQWRAAIEPRLGTIEMGVSWEGLNVGIMLDNLSQAAQARAVSINYQWP